MSEFFFEPRGDSVDSFLPDEVEPLTPEEAFAQTEAGILADVPDDDLIVAEDEPEPIGQSWKFDFSHPTTTPTAHLGGGFVTAGSQGPLKTRGMATLYGWIEKCLRTDRGAHPIHPDGYGLERPFDMIGLPVEQSLGGDLEGRIRDALTFHPRIAGIRDFKRTIDPDEDFVGVDFTVVLDDTSELPVKVSLVP